MAYTVARLNLALNAANADVTHAQLHTGAPGAAGTDNVASAAARATLSLSSASSAQATGEALFSITGATAALTHATLWNAATGGTLQASGTLSPAESFAGQGTLTVTVVCTGSST